jgi:hypothetical protein
MLDFSLRLNISCIGIVLLNKVNQVRFDGFKVFRVALKLLGTFVNVDWDHAVVHLLLDVINSLLSIIKLSYKVGQSIITLIKFFNLNSHLSDVSGTLTNFIFDKIGINLSLLEVLVNLNKILLSRVKAIYVLSDGLFFVMIISIFVWTSAFVHLVKSNLQNFDLGR